MTSGGRSGMSMLVGGLARRLRLDALVARHDARWVMATFAFVNGLVSIGVMASCALATRQPFVFPSLGPTAFLLFSAPTSAAASPRNTVFGHAIGAGAGYAALLLFGLRDQGAALGTEVTVARVGAAALSLALTSGLMVLVRVPHAPAGATTLIVSLGILPEPGHLLVLMLAVLLLSVQGYVINRLAGVDVPRWTPRS